MQYTRRLSCFERNPETYLRTVTEYKPVDFQPSAFSLAEGRFCLTIIEHPLIALQHCISLRCHTSCKESATPAEEIPELSAGQAEW